MSRLLPVYRRLSVGTETPVSLYQKLKPLQPAFLLEKAEGSEHTARCWYIGLKPFAAFVSSGLHTTFTCRGKTEKLIGRPLDLLAQILKRCHSPKQPELPMFCGGAAGYIGYDTVRTIEKLPAAAADDLALPDVNLVFCRAAVIYDCSQRTAAAVVNHPEGEDLSAAHKILDSIEALLHQPAPPPAPDKPLPPAAVSSSLSKEAFTAAVQKAKEYIAAGDIFQVVLSQRLQCGFTADAFNVYRTLRRLNPSPYMYYLELPGDIKIAGASPEMLVKVENGAVQTRPIAGTRPRGKDCRQDEELALSLLQDEKERAEHVMLVDLARNDLGRVCRPGSVQVDSFMQVEKFSHVMHITSDVKGILAEDRTAVDALKACFPAGTVSGAPKIRAMEIINELESVKRGPYAGAIGFFGFNGTLDTAIAIRTIVFHQGHAYLQAGAGIVADSNPENEYQECLNKAAALLKALGTENLKGVIPAGAAGN